MRRQAIRPRARDSKSRFGRRRARPGVHHRRLFGERLEDRHLLSGAAVSYTVTDLGTLGGTSSHAYGINNSGQVVGDADGISLTVHGFLWESGTGILDLGTFGGAHSHAYAINDTGQVAGWSYNSDGACRAFLWQSGSGMQDLGTLGGNYSLAYGINNNGQVVGSDGHAFLWQSGSGMQDLGTLGGNYSLAYGINNNGQVVGCGDGTSFSDHAFLWENGTAMLDLGTLPGASASEARGINDIGQIVGDAYGSGRTHAFLWQSESGMQDLGTLGGGSSSAYAINNSGQVVGQASPSQGADHAFVWQTDTGMVDLNSLIPASSGWTLVAAHAINDRGQIVGEGSSPSGRYHAFLLTPVPGTPQLDPGSDSGVSSTDNITNVTTPTFKGTAGAGSTVRIYSDGVLVGSGMADDGGAYQVAVTTPLADGPHSITAQTTDPAGNVSGFSGALSVTIHTAAPLADVVDVAPDPRTTAVSEISVVFSEAVYGLDLADLTLRRDGGENLLTASQTLTTTDNIIWTLGNLSGLTGTLAVNTTKTFDLTLTAAGSGVADVAGNALSADASDTWLLVNPLSFTGTPGDDTFTFTAGDTWHEVVMTLDGDSPTTYRYAATESPHLSFDGGGGRDTVVFNGGAGDLTAQLYPDHGVLLGGDYTVSVSHVEQMTVNATPDGQDVARLYDSTGDDTFTAYPTYAVLADGASYTVRVNDFRFVMAYANQGGTDAALFFDSEGNDTFTSTPTWATMTGTWRPDGADRWTTTTGARSSTPTRRPPRRGRTWRSSTTRPPAMTSSSRSRLGPRYPGAGGRAGPTASATRALTPPAATTRPN